MPRPEEKNHRKSNKDIGTKEKTTHMISRCSKNRRSHLASAAIRFGLPPIFVLIIAITMTNASLKAATTFPDNRWWDSSFDANGLARPSWRIATAGDSIYVIGSIQLAGSLAVRNIARWNGSKWAKVGGGVDALIGGMTAIAAEGASVYVAGDFNRVFQSSGSAVVATNIARWNGTSWSRLGTGIRGIVLAMAPGNGFLYAGGEFMSAGGQSAANVAAWDGTKWTALGSGVNGQVYGMAFTGGNLYAAGVFDRAGIATVSNFARWDGTNWWSIPNSPFTHVHAMTPQGSNLIAAGSSLASGSAIYRWTGASWISLASNLPFYVTCLTATSNSIYVGGEFNSAGGVPAHGVARLDACGWSALGSGIEGEPRGLAINGSKLFATGSFTTAGQNISRNIAAWNGVDLPLVQVVDENVVEGGEDLDFAVVTLSLCPAVTDPLQISYSTSNETATAYSDYLPVSGTITVEPGSSLQAIAIPIIGDRMYEPDESFYLNLSSTGRVVFSQTSMRITLLNDDPVPSVSISDSTVYEGDNGTNEMAFEVSLSSPHGSEILILCRATDGTAVEGRDYLGPAPAHYFDCIFPPGTTKQKVVVPILTDTYREIDKELSLTLFSSIPTINAQRAVATGRILNDDITPVISLNWPDYPESFGSPEGDVPRDWPLLVNLSAPSSSPVSVNFTTIDGSATAGSDYLPASGHIIFPPGTTTQFMTLRIQGDIYQEPSETIRLVFSNPSNADLVHTQYVTTIINDDALTIDPDLSLTLINTNLHLPTRMAFAPDGRLFVCEQEGNVKIIKDGEELADPFLRIPVESNRETEAGLLGITFDPGFFTNQFFYLFYTAKTPPNSAIVDGRIRNRISRFRAQGDALEPGSEVMLLDTGDVPNSYFHNGGDLKFGPDGKLYISVGDNFYKSSNAQTMTNLFGKILRLNSDGTIPEDNPFFSTTEGNNRAIWALGFRNPFSICFAPQSGRLFVNDVGSEYWEEINEVLPAGNYGWPVNEGSGSSELLINPLYSYNAARIQSGRAAITAGVFIDPTNSKLPVRFHGSYLFADIYRGIWQMTFASNFGVTNFAWPNGAIDLKQSPDGLLYAMDRYNFLSGRIWRFDSPGTSPSFQSIRLDQEKGIELTMKVGTTGNFRIESSTDFRNWNPVTTIAPSARIHVYTDPIKPNGSTFYRILR